MLPNNVEVRDETQAFEKNHGAHEAWSRFESGCTDVFGSGSADAVFDTDWVNAK